MAKKTAPKPEDITEAEVAEATGLPDNALFRDELAVEVRDATTQLIDAFESTHPFVRENLLRQLCYTTERQPQWLDERMQTVMAQIQDRWTNSPRQEIDIANRDRQLEYFEQLGEDKMVYVLLHNVFVELFNEHAAAHDRPSYGSKNVKPKASTNTADTEYLQKLAATYGIIPKTTKEQIEEAEQVAA